MLPKNVRLTTSADFSRATKSGIRVTTENYVGYLYIPAVTNQNSPKCGLIINKSVGGSVARHALARKIRHALAPLISELPQGSLVVIRALAKKNSLGTTTEIEKIIRKLLERSKKSSVL